MHSSLVIVVIKRPYGVTKERACILKVHKEIMSEYNCTGFHTAYIRNCLVKKNIRNSEFSECF